MFTQQLRFFKITISGGTEDVPFRLFTTKPMLEEDVINIFENALSNLLTTQSDIASIEGAISDERRYLLAGELQKSNLYLYDMVLDSDITLLLHGLKERLLPREENKNEGGESDSA